jgi:hypothetical protein
LRGPRHRKEHSAGHERAANVDRTAFSSDAIDRLKIANRVIVPNDLTAVRRIRPQMAVERSRENSSPESPSPPPTAQDYTASGRRNLEVESAFRLIMHWKILGLLLACIP